MEPANGISAVGTMVSLLAACTDLLMGHLPNRLCTREKGSAAPICMISVAELLTFRAGNCYNTKNFMATSELRTALQKEAADNIELGEALFGMLKRKAEQQLTSVAPAYAEETVELWRALLDMHEVQATLLRERFRLSVLNLYR